MSLRNILLYMVVVVAMSLASCTPSVPSQYLQPDEMEDILFDYHLAQAVAEKGGNKQESRYNQSLYYHAVLDKHGVTEADFDSSLVYYYTYTDRLADVYDNVSKRLQDEAMRAGAMVGDINKYSEYSTTGDTANVWTEASAMVLLPEPPYNKYTFSIEADSTYELGDSYLFMFDADFLVQQGSKEANVCFVLTYENDSVAVFYNTVRNPGAVEMRASASTKKALKNIRGFIYFGYGSKNVGAKILFINKIQLVRFHKVKTPHQTEDNDKTEEIKSSGHMETPDVQSVQASKESVREPKGSVRGGKGTAKEFEKPAPAARKLDRSVLKRRPTDMDAPLDGEKLTPLKITDEQPQ